MISYLFSYHIILLFLRYFRFSDLIPLDLICFHVKFEAASIAFVYNSILRLVGVVYDTVFAVLYIGVDFYIVICGIPAVQFFLCRCGPEDCTVEDTAVLEAVRKSADIDTTAFSEVLHLPSALPGLSGSESQFRQVHKYFSFLHRNQRLRHCLTG